MQQEAVAVLETATVAANVQATELALKGTKVRLVELRLADYELSGKAVSLFNGELHEVEAAMDLAGDFLRGRKEYVRHRTICQPHEALTQYLADGTRFATAKPREREGEEVS
jgi:microcompartment protein CcmL/EutN